MPVYKNIRDKDIRMTLFGVGEVFAPAGRHTSLPSHVAEVINAMTPTPSLVEVEDAGERVAEAEELTPRQKIMQALDDLGVEYKRNASTESLEQMLQEALAAQ